MAVLAPVTLRSAPFAFAKTPNSVDVAVSGSGVESGTLGAQLHCLEGKVGSWKLEDKDLGAITYDRNGAARARIPIPVHVQNDLAGGCPRLKLEFHIGGEAGASIVLADVSLRSQTPPIARESDAMCGLPNKSALVQSAVETPEGHWDYQSWLASAATQAELPLLQEILSKHDDKLLGILADHEKQQVVIVVDRSELQRGKLQAELEAADIALPLRMQPTCRPVKALRALQARFETQTFPEGTPSLAGHLDTEFGEYQVTVDVDTEESAEELEWNRRRVLGLERVQSTAHLVPSPAAVSYAERAMRTFGPMLTVRFGRPGTRGRLNDGQRHFGAAGIGNGTNFCTSGFIVNRDGFMGSVTAGHCFKNNNTTIKSGTLAYGISGGIATYPLYDMTRIEPGNQTYTNTIHTDPGSPTTRIQVAKKDSVHLEIVCVSGMVTGAKCGIEVLDKNCMVYNANLGGTTYNLTRGVRNGITIGQSGDSGAPVYRPVGAVGASIAGMETGGAVDDEICFHEVSLIESKLGVQVAL